MDEETILLWYPDGNRGKIRFPRCVSCKGTGLRPPRFGEVKESDVRAAEDWAQSIGLDLPEPTSVRVRGFAYKSAREADMMSGEIICGWTDTARSDKASTTVASA